MLMPLSEETASRNMAVALTVLLLSAWMVFLLVVVPSGAGETLGMFFLAVGAAAVALHRIFGRWTFKQGSFFPVGSGLWKSIGPDGARWLNLGIGLVLAAAGLMFLIKFHLRL